MKISGWMGKLDFEDIKRKSKMPYPKEGLSKTISPTVYKTKGMKSEYSYGDWPPVKVSITINEI